MNRPNRVGSLDSNGWFSHGKISKFYRFNGKPDMLADNCWMHSLQRLLFLRFGIEAQE